MNSNDTSPNNLPNPLDYEQLKAYGLEYIRSIANKQWTDFNLHDPGVTILEALCFALTDLAYRTQFSMADLLTKKGEEFPRPTGTLFPAHEILSHEPVTANDYRKLILENVPGIRNIWIDCPETGEKQGSMKSAGRYRFNVELEDETFIQHDSRLRSIIGRDERWRFLESFGHNYKEAYKNYIRNFYLKHRNLCEDLEEVKILEPIYIGIHAEIEIERHAHYQRIIEEMTLQIGEHLSPALKLQTLPELIKKGKTPEEIYQGTLPHIGFIDAEELRRHKRKKIIFISDILNILMKIKGVVSVKRLYFLVNEDDLDKSNIEVDSSYGNCNKVRLTSENCVFRLSAFNEGCPPQNEIYFISNGITFAPKGMNRCNFRQKETVLPNKEQRHDFPLLKGRHRNLSTYNSFQNLFPKTYRMGIERIPGSASHLLKAERLQLKAYLTFFDQLIADYLEQLASIEQYFAVCPIVDRAQDDRTYFFHELNDKEITDVSQVLKPFDERELRTEQQTTADIDRRSRVMDHLLARFNTAFVDYSLLAYLIGPNNTNDAYQLLQFEREEIEDKKQLLRNYPVLSRHRSQAIDYTEEVKLTGVERMILAQLGVNKPRYDCVPPIVRTRKKETFDEKGNKTVTIKHYFHDNRKENYNDSFGIHIIEHPLLLPHGEITENRFLKLNREDYPGTLLDNPYSFRATVLVTGWLDICQNMEFRAFVESTIREALPAHVAAKICWVDPFIMWKAEKTYREYIKILKRQPVVNVKKRDWMNWTVEKDKGIESMLKVFDELRNIYPSIILPNVDGSGHELRPRLDFMHIDAWIQDIWREERKDEAGKAVTIIENWAFSKQKANK